MTLVLVRSGCCVVRSSSHCSGALWFAGTLALQVLLLTGCGKPEKPGASVGADAKPEKAAVKELRYVGSESCRECHADIQDKWTGSQHHLAEREMDASYDDPAFVPSQTVRVATQDSTFAKKEDGTFEMTLNAPGGETAFPAKRAIGLTPLVQYLAEIKPGSLQAVDMAWDPHKKEWFNVFGDEDRRPGEWGHWSGRGMNWNAMCASCHNTATWSGITTTPRSIAGRSRASTWRHGRLASRTSRR